HGLEIRGKRAAGHDVPVHGPRATSVQTASEPRARRKRGLAIEWAKVVGRSHRQAAVAFKRRIPGATRPCWSERSDHAVMSRNSERLPAGANPARPKLNPAGR